MPLPWIKLATDLPDHPKTLELGEMTGAPLAWAHVVAAWTWAARFAAHGRIEGRDPARTFERAARWQGEPGRLAEACLAVGFLDRGEGGALQLHDFTEHNGAHAQKLERDRQGATARYRARIARDSRENRAVEERRGEEITPIAPLPGGGAGASPPAPLPEGAPPTPGGAPPRPAEPSAGPDPSRRPPRRPREPHAPATPEGDAASVVAAWREWIDPHVAVTAGRLALVEALLAPQGPFTAAQLVAAIEGAAGSAFWRWANPSGASLLTWERVFEGPAKVEELSRQRQAKGWRDPRPKAAAPATKTAPPATPPPPDPAAAAEAERIRQDLRAKLRLGVAR